jgi:hypothetical protein
MAATQKAEKRGFRPAFPAVVAQLDRAPGFVSGRLLVQVQPIATPQVRPSTWSVGGLFLG